MLALNHCVRKHRVDRRQSVCRPVDDRVPSWRRLTTADTSAVRCGARRRVLARLRAAPSSSPARGSPSVIRSPDGARRGSIKFLCRLSQAERPCSAHVRKQQAKRDLDAASSDRSSVVAARTTPSVKTAIPRLPTIGFTCDCAASCEGKHEHNLEASRLPPLRPRPSQLPCKSQHDQAKHARQRRRA